MYKFVFPLLLVTALVSGCAHDPQRDSEELRSQMRQVESYAAEGLLFIDYVQQGHATKVYSAEHPLYLEKKAAELSNKLDHAKAGARLGQLLIVARHATDRLRKAFELLAGTNPDYHSLKNELEQVQQEARRFRQAP